MLIYVYFTPSRTCKNFEERWKLVDDADFADDRGRAFGSADFDLREVAALRHFLTGFIGAVPTLGRHEVGALFSALGTGGEAPGHDAIAEQVVDHDVDLGV